MRSNRYWAAPLLAGAAAVLAACGSTASPGTTNPGSGSTAQSNGSTAQSNSSASSTSSGNTVVSTRKTGIGTVLVNAQGRTLYWFAKDTATASNCNGSCATYWPPVLGKATAASGTSLTMGFGTVTRSGGKVQATYDGHPLYTYAGDTSAGMTAGNKLNLSGGLWWAMTPSGATLASTTSSNSSSTSTGGGGYGY
jgi:predicted lipoprotein with Yx(FWY)xxD motif